MKKIFLIISILSILSLPSFSAKTQDDIKKNFLGDWNYELNEAPYGYEKGIISFIEKDSNLTCLVKLEAGTIPADSIRIEAEKIIIIVTVDNNPIKVVLSLKDNKLVGKVDTPEGQKDLTAKKIIIQ